MAFDVGEDLVHSGSKPLTPAAGRHGATPPRDRMIVCMSRLGRITQYARWWN
jgi:hypothetical protein